MKRFIFALVSLCASIGFSQTITPITSFQPGSYLGDGSWLGDDGTSGYFASYVTLQNNGWNTVTYRNGQIFLYESVLEIDANGFFTTTLTNSSNPSSPAVYEGYGNCGTIQCIITVIMPNGTLHKSMIFDAAEKKIHIFAGIYFTDGTPNIQWRETIAHIPTTTESATALKPITGFQPNNYVGSGAWLKNDSTTGTFRTFTNIQTASMTVAKFSNNNLNIYDSNLTFDPYGFFTVKVDDDTDITNPIYHYGIGNCAGTQCQMTIALDNGTLQNNMKFDPVTSSIYSFGAIYFTDGTPNVQWEETSFVIP